MRELTKRQKVLIKKWYIENRKDLKPCCFGKADEMPSDIYEEIEKIHPTEIHYQNVNAYLEELCFNWFTIIK